MRNPDVAVNQELKNLLDTSLASRIELKAIISGIHCGDQRFKGTKELYSRRLTNSE